MESDYKAYENTIESVNLNLFPFTDAAFGSACTMTPEVSLPKTKKVKGFVSAFFAH